MREPKRTRLALLALAGGIWLQSALPAQEPAPEPEPAQTTSSAAGVLAEAADSGSNTAPATVTNEATAREDRPGRVDRGPLVSIGHDVELKAGDSAEVVVVIGGSAKISGKVRDAAVAVWGNLDIQGEVGDAAVTVLGDLKVGPDAKINGEAVAVAGKVDAAPTAKIRGQPVTVDFPTWLKQWFVQCVLKMRPLSLKVGFVWAVAGAIFLFYLLIAAAFPRPVAACVSELARRPATTFLMGLLAQLLLPLVIVILGATGIGLLVVPFIVAALMFGALVGKVGFLEWIGFQLGRQAGAQGLQNGIVALLIGGLIITLLYLVPVLGLLTFAIVSVWSLGAAMTAAFGGLRKELPEKPAAPPPGTGATITPGTGPVGGPEAAAPGVMPAASEPGASWAAGGAAGATTATVPLSPPVLPETLSYPRVGFWERMGAGFLDILLVSILGSIVHIAPLGFLIALAYFSGMWAWKGTTIGGIVLGLKVARMDGQPVTFPVALVRALAAAFSIIVAFLGFLWIAWDAEKQGWHDKIAGTVVLKLPRGTPLVCF